MFFSPVMVGVIDGTCVYHNFKQERDITASNEVIFDAERQIWWSLNSPSTLRSSVKATAVTIAL